MKANRPIAVFDSGVGGLTVLKVLRRRMPRENLLYFGDTAHVPYGTKSPQTVRRLVKAPMRFLARRGVKCVVVACNTVSAVALADVRRLVRVPVVGAIDPGVDRALQVTRGRVGVIGTSTTIGSGAYQRRLRKRGWLRKPERVRVSARACPLFVPLAEEGWARHDVARRAAVAYLGQFRKARVDTVILGCTHYPLLKAVIRRVLGGGVRLVDSAEAMSRVTERMLAGAGLLRRGKKLGRTVFCLTDTGGSFPWVAQRFLNRKLGRLVKVGVKLVALSDTEKKR